MMQEAARAGSPFACERPCPTSAPQGGGQENWQVAGEKGKMTRLQPLDWAF